MRLSEASSVRRCGTHSISAYRALSTAAVFVGSIGGLEFVRKISDTMNAPMAIPPLNAVPGSVKLILGRMHECLKRRPARRRDG